MALYVNGKQISGGGGGGNTNSVELTYAEYQALTPEQQLDGTEYFITDINGDGSQFQPVIYSETEREIGVWTDGKPLYQKTINDTFTNSTSLVIDITSLSVGALVAIKGILFASDTTTQIVIDEDSAGGVKFTGANQFAIAIGRNNASSYGYTPTVYVTLQYTKTTDQAGSGTWTPQGVPAHHYSTDEQVVGTWIDGNTLYEKTVSFVTPSSNAYTRQNLGLLTADIDNIWIAEGYAIGANTTANVSGYTSTPSSEEFMGFIYKESTGITFDYRVGSSLQNGNAYLTIRYTKAST